MSTTLAKPAEMADRKWYVIDAAGKPLGRVAAKAAVILRGKNKTTFTPNVDCGDHVIIINCDEAVLTGKKLEKKFHRTHSGWIGGLKETQYKTLMAENSDKAMTYAVKGMIPSNTIGAKAMTRLHCYKAADHAHAAQNFGLETLKLLANSPLVLTENEGKFDVVVNVVGGGCAGQAGAIRHGLSRALLQFNPELRATLKKAGFLTRDPRMKERKKYGLKAARRAPQFSKR